MAVVIGGAGLGNYDVLGQAGIKFSGTKNLNINASTGNLVVRGNDHTLVSQGLDITLARTYNSQGSQSDFDGDNWRFSFEKEVRIIGDNLQRVTGDGHIATFKRQEDGSYISHAGKGAHDTLRKEGDNWVYTEGSSGIKETYRASDGRLMSSMDKHGNKVTYRYDGNKLSTISGAGGEQLNFVYNSKGQLSRLDSYTLIDEKLTHSHSTVHYSYDVKGRLSQVDVDLSPEDKSISDGKVFTTSYTYQDSESHLIKSINKSDGSNINLAYQTVDGKVRLSRIDDNGVVTELNYDSKRSNGHQLKVTDNNSESWYYKHDDEGRLISTLNPTVNYQSNVAGLPRAEDQVQGVTSYLYDDQDNLIIVKDSTGKEIQNKYDANGNLIEVLRNGVLQLKNEYSNNKLISIHSFNDGKKEASAFYIYDNAKLRFEISAKGNVIEHNYNGFGERTSMRKFIGESLKADSAPALSEMITWSSKQDKQLSELTEYTYQRGELHTQTTYNRLDSDGQGSTIPDNAEHIQTTYDAFGNLLNTQKLTGNIKTGELEVVSSTTQVFDGLNRITSTTDGVGNTITTQYLDASKQVLITNENGVTIRRTFSERGEMLTETTSATGEVSRERTYLYSNSGQLIASINANGSVSTQFYDDSGQLWITVSESGQATEYQRDSEGRVIREIQYNSSISTQNWIVNSELVVTGNDVLGLIDSDQEHRVIQTQYDALGRVHLVIDGEQQVSEYKYDNLDRQIEVRHYKQGFEQSARVMTSKYDSAGNLIEQVDADGYVKRFYYDEANNLIETQKDQDSTKVFYDSRGRQQYILDEQGYLTETRYLDGGREKVTYRYSAVVTNRDGGIESIKSQASNATLLSRERFDEAGRLISSTNLKGIETQYRYDEISGQLRQQITAANTNDSRSIYFDYNKFGESTGRVAASGQQDWKAINVANLVDQRGTRSTYNVMGWKVSEHHPATGRTDYEYDNAGRLIKTTDALGNTRSTRYTSFGQIKQSLNGGVVKSEYVYDRAGRLTREVDGENVVTSYLYNNQNQVEYQVRQQVSDAYQSFQPLSGHLISRQVTHYRYDARGNVIDRSSSQDFREGTRISDGDTLNDVRNSNLRYKTQWTRKYDHRGRVISETDGNGREKVVDYQQGGRIKTVKLSGALQERIEIDALGRTIKVANGLGESTRYEYNDNSNTVTIVSPGGIRTVTEKNAHGETLSITDGLGHRRQFHYNHLGQVIRTEFFAAGSNSAEVISQKEYDANTGLLRFETDAEGTRTEVRYNVIGQQWKIIRDANGEKIQTEYGYDSQGQRIWEDTEGQRTYIRYDNNGRKVHVEQGGHASTYQYDANGNVIRMVEGAVSGSSKVHEERVTEYNYDSNNNLLDKRVKSGSDWAGTASSHTTRYSYDNSGNVIEKANGVGGVTRYVYDDLGRVQYEINALRYVTEFQYDDANRVTKTIRYNTAIANQAEWTEITVSDALRSSSSDRISELRYDNEGRIAYEVDGKGYATGYAYDANGQVIQTTYFGNPVTENGWDSSNNKRVSESIYDEKGRLQYSIDTQGRITERGYDSEGRITHTIKYDTEFKLVSRSSASINSLKSHLSAEVAAGNVRAELSVYDQLGRKRFALDADGYLVEYQYNRQSQKTRKREYIDNKAVLSALNDVRSGNKNINEYQVFVALVHSLQTLESAPAELQAQLSELNYQQGRITELFSELTTLEKEIAETNNANHDLGISIETANKRLADLQKEVEVELTRHAELQRKINELEIEIEYHENRLKAENATVVDNARNTLDNARDVLNQANVDKSNSAKNVRNRLVNNTLTSIHPEWKAEYTDKNGKAYKSVNSDADANSALNMISQHRKILVGEKNTLQAKLSSGENTNTVKKQLNDVLDAIDFLDKLAVDIQSDIRIRARVNHAVLEVKAAEGALELALAEQTKTIRDINSNPTVSESTSNDVINKLANSGNEAIDIPVTSGSTTELLDKIDALKSKVQMLTADIDTQKSIVDFKASELALREKEYAVAREAYNQAQSERQAEINAAQKVVDNAQNTRNSAWSEYQAAEDNRKANQNNQAEKQSAYNSAKANYDSKVRAKNSAQANYDSKLRSKNAAQTSLNNANNSLSSAKSNASSKQSTYNTARNNYNYHHNEWVKANNHYNAMVSNRDSDWRTRESKRVAYENAVNDYNAYNRLNWYNEETGGKTSAGLNSRRATRDARLREYQSANNNYNYWKNEASKAASNRSSKWNTRVHYLNAMNTAKRNLDTANSQVSSAQSSVNNASRVLSDATKAFDATKGPLTSATNAVNAAYSSLTNASNALNSANNALSSANTRFSNANTAWKASEVVLEIKKHILQETMFTIFEQVELAKIKYEEKLAEKIIANISFEAVVNYNKVERAFLKAQSEESIARSQYQIAQAEYEQVIKNHHASEEGGKSNDEISLKRDERDQARNIFKTKENVVNNFRINLKNAIEELKKLNISINYAQTVGVISEWENHNFANEINKAIAEYNAAESEVLIEESAVENARILYDRAHVEYENTIKNKVVSEEGGVSGVSQAEINAKRYERDKALNILNAREKKLNSSNERLKKAEKELDRLNIEANKIDTINSVKEWEKRVTESNKAFDDSKVILNELIELALESTSTVKYEVETKEALQQSQREYQSALDRLDTLQQERDTALEEQIELMNTLSEKGSGSNTLVDASIDSIESAEALKATAEKSMVKNQEQVVSLKDQLRVLANNIDDQRNKLSEQKRIYEESIVNHDASKNHVQSIIKNLRTEQISLSDANATIISWEETKRSRAQTVKAAELTRATKASDQTNAQNNLNNASSILSSNKAIKRQREADRNAAKSALAQANKELQVAITVQTNNKNAVQNDRNWADALWVFDKDYKNLDAVYQYRLNNKYRTLSEELGGGSVGYTQSQINAAKNDRKAALDRLNKFKSDVSNSNSPIYTSDPQTALNKLNQQYDSVKILKDSFYAEWQKTVREKHTDEEGNTSNAYSQAQINARKSDSDRAARALQQMSGMRAKLNDHIAANKARAAAEAEVNRHKEIVASRESLLIEASNKVDSAQSDYNNANTALTNAKEALAIAVKNVESANKAMDEAEVHLQKARVLMDRVEGSIVTIRANLDVAKSDESRALEAVVAARGEFNVAQNNLNVAKDELNTTVQFLNVAYDELQSATQLHGKVTAYLERATVYKDRAGDTLSEAQQLIYLSTLSITRDMNAGTVSNDTDYQYDARGQLISELSATVSYAQVGSDGSVIQKIGRLETQYSYDSLGNVVATTTAAGTSMADTKRFVFNVMGDQTQSIGLAGSSVIYNDQNLATVNINAENGRRDRVYSQLGQLRFEIDEEGFVTEHKYNAFGRKLEQIRHSAKYTEARPNGRAIALVDMERFVLNGGESRTIRWTYDKAGQQIETQQLSSKNAYSIKDSVTFNGYGEKISTTRTYDGKTVATGQQLYNGDGQLVFSMDAEGYVTKFIYNNFGELAKQVEFANAYQTPNSESKSWTVEALNTWIAKPDSGSLREVSYTYDNRGNTLTTTRHDVVYHTLDANNNVVEKKQDITTTTYHDFANRMYMSVQEEGTVNAESHDTATNRVLYEYDALGRLVSSWGKEREYILTGLGIAVGSGDKPSRLAAHQRTDYLYDAQGNQISVLTEGRSTFQYFNARGQLTGRKDAQGNYTAIQTDAMNRVVSETQKVSTSGALNYSYDKVTSYEYDKTGRQTSTTINSSSGNITQAVDYNAFGEVTEKRHIASDVEQVQESYQYDGFGRVESAIRKGIETTYQYNWMDKVTVETTGGSNVIRREYNNLGNMISEQGVTFDGKTPLTTQVFDRYGNVLSKNVNGATYNFKYNHANQVIEQRAPEVDTVDRSGNIAKRRPVIKMYYNENGNRIGVQDANGNWQKSLYDTAGQKLADINGVGSSVHYYHNAHGEMVGRINPLNQGEMFTYNNNGQLLSRARLDLSKHYIEVYELYAYDQAGQRYKEEWVGESGHTQWTHFDQAGRVLETLGGGQHRRYSYDSFGNKSREAWLEGGQEKANKSATFDHYGRQTSETWLDGTVVNYTHNAKGELTRKHSSGIGLDIRFEYFNNGLLKKQTLGGKSETYKYDANGKQIQRTLIEGEQQLTTNTRWDSHGRLASISTSAAKGFGKTLSNGSVTYAYDALGNRRKVTSQLGSQDAETRWFRYDGDNRMTESHLGAKDTGAVDNKQGSRRITYNAAGQKVQELTWRSVTRSGSQQVIKEQNTFGYDVYGHLNKIENYEYNGAARHQTRFLFQENSRTGHALSQEQVTTSYEYINGLIKDNSGKTDKTTTYFTYIDGRLDNQRVENKYSVRFDYHYSGQLALQTISSTEHGFIEKQEYAYQGKESFRKVKVTAERDQKSWKDGNSEFKYNAAGHLNEVTSSKSDSQRKVLTDFNGQIALQLAGGKLSAELAVNGNPIAQLSDNKLDADLLNGSAANTGAQPGSYTVKANDNLQRISQMVYGDSRYWYLIADANGLSPNDKLTVGKSLVIPNQHTQTYNGAESFKPYNESEVLGNVNPDPIAPPPPKKSCNPIAMIVMAVVAVVVAIYAPQALGLVKGSLEAMVVGAAAGSAAAQGVGMAMGVVDEFSWEQVALAAATAGVTNGVSNLGLEGVQGAVVKAAASYATNYAGSKALGRDVSFSWTNLAASVAGAYASGQVSEIDAFNSLDPVFEDTLGGFAASAVSSSVRGESFGDNAGLFALDAFGNALGNSMHRSSRVAAEKARVEQLSSTDGMASRNGVSAYFDGAINDSSSLYEEAEFFGAEILPNDIVEDGELRDVLLPDGSSRSFGSLEEYKRFVVSLQHKGEISFNDATRKLVKLQPQEIGDKEPIFYPSPQGHKLEPMQEGWKDDHMAFLNANSREAQMLKVRNNSMQWQTAQTLADVGAVVPAQAIEVVELVNTAYQNREQLKEIALESYDNGGFVLAKGFTGNYALGSQQGAAAFGAWISADWRNDGINIDGGIYWSGEYGANLAKPNLSVDIGVEAIVFTSPVYKKALEGHYKLVSGAYNKHSVSNISADNGKISGYQYTHNIKTPFSAYSHRTDAAAQGSVGSGGYVSFEELFKPDLPRGK
ncbi:DUF6531 domain-containing protein [Photobacterium leiognathi]|uniref:DUF6531 domain-containing protein n=1 Tax=Photobacterium leiognathi TaxID=553611 RepID=UPI0029820424|nr:DUF6531 domain-containing protein [Photobacterium leiognathi]